MKAIDGRIGYIYSIYIQNNGTRNKKRHDKYMYINEKYEKRKRQNREKILDGKNKPNQGIKSKENEVKMKTRRKTEK